MRSWFYGIRKSVTRCFDCLPAMALLITVLLYACGNSEETRKFAEKQSHLSDNLVNAHKQFIKDESQAIDDFFKRHNYQLKVSPTGLRYAIESTGRGDSVIAGNKVSLKYSIYLLDGTLCYTSDSLGVMVFEVNKGDVPNGIQEAVLMMRKGDKAQLVLPAHLAYGLSGDQNKIPLESALYCTIELTEIEKNNHNNN